MDHSFEPPGTHRSFGALEHIRVERDGELTVVYIDRPPANALDLALLEEAESVVQGLSAEGPRGVVITGTGGFFSAGVDLKAAPTLGREDQQRMVAGLNRLFASLYGFPGPLVCAVSGHAIAGGLILALCGDYRVGALEGRLGLTEVKAGIPYPAVAMAVVRAELTAPVARRLVLGGELVGPEEAQAMGLVDELRPPAQVLPRAVEVARELAALPLSAYARIKRQLREEALKLRDEPDPSLEAWLGEETQEAAVGLLRRPPSTES